MGYDARTPCEKGGLESNTLTPLLKRLEILGYITRNRGKTDERQVFVGLTQRGRSLQAHAPAITRCIVVATGYNQKKLEALVKTIATLRDNVTNSGLKS